MALRDARDRRFAILERHNPPRNPSPGTDLAHKTIYGYITTPLEYNA